jgi:hypothetical protein
MCEKASDHPVNVNHLLYARPRPRPRPRPRSRPRTRPRPVANLSILAGLFTSSSNFRFVIICGEYTGTRLRRGSLTIKPALSMTFSALLSIVSRSFWIASLTEISLFALMSLQRRSPSEPTVFECTSTTVGAWHRHTRG